MKKTFKFGLIASVILVSAGSYAGAPTANMTFTGQITPTADNCTINVPASLDLGQVKIADIDGVEPMSEYKPKDFTVYVTNCNVGQHVQIHLNGTPDSRNSQMLANSDGEGNAVYAGIAIHEHVDGTAMLIDPSNGSASEDTVDAQGNVTHAFTASITPVDAALGVAPGLISVAATLTLEAI